MASRRLGFQGFSTVVMLLLLGVTWYTLVPRQFGGRATYAIVNGNSMEPGFFRGDLVILHPASNYQVGDVATYLHPSNGLVVHRIIGRDAGQFIFQGDNNSWIDSYRPLPSEITGRLWLHIPSAGKILERLRSPWIIALLVVGGGIVTMPRMHRSQGQHRKDPRNQISRGESNRTMDGNSKADLLITLTGLALGSILLAFFAFTRPRTQILTEEIHYDQRGVFGYSASAPPGVYASEVVQTGEPIFRRLIEVVNVTFDYEVATQQPTNLAGTYRLVAEISHSNGWKRTIELQPETSFSGNSFNAGGVINLAEVQALIDNVEQQTGLQHQQYTLAVVPEIFIQGAIAGQQLQDRFSPRLTFQLDKLQMQIVEKNGSGSGSQNPFKPSKQGLLTQPRQAPNTLSMFGFQLEIWTARLFSLIGLTLAVGGMTVMGLLTFQGGPGTEAARLQAKYGPLLVTVQGTDFGPESRKVELSTIDDLVKIAERNGRMILHQTQGSTHDYFVQEGEVTYRYRITEQRSKRVTPVMKVRPLS